MLRHLSLSISLILLMTLLAGCGGPPDSVILDDFNYDEISDVRIIGKVRCDYLPEHVRALGVREVWLVSLDYTSTGAVSPTNPTGHVANYINSYSLAKEGWASSFVKYYLPGSRCP